MIVELLSCVRTEATQINFPITWPITPEILPEILLKIRIFCNFYEFQRGFYSFLFAESHVLESQSQNDMNVTKKKSRFTTLRAKRAT